MEMVDMSEEAQEFSGINSGAPIPSNPYPYGLRLNLTHEQLEKLGYSELPPAGTMVKLEAVACVVRVESCDPDADGDVDYSCIELQLCHLGLEEEGESYEEDDDDDGEGSRAERMYEKGKQKA